MLDVRLNLVPLVVHKLSVVSVLSANASLATHSVVAVLISNVSHLVSIYLLYKLCEEIKTEAEYGAKAVVVALLHVIAPAGIFLSAPYGESLFAALTFAGCLAYARSRQGTPLHSSNLYLILAGLSFGLSCTIRGNGIFSGLIFLWELLQSVLALRDGRLPSIAKTLRAATVMLAGLLVAAGAAYPQYFAWTEYCRHTSSKDRRPWCNTYLPSIYTFVQQHYW